MFDNLYNNCVFSFAQIFSCILIHAYNILSLSTNEKPLPCLFSFLPSVSYIHNIPSKPSLGQAELSHCTKMRPLLAPLSPTWGHQLEFMQQMTTLSLAVQLVFSTNYCLLRCTSTCCLYYYRWCQKPC